MESQRKLLLVRLGYPSAIIYKGDRSRYLAALRRADQGDPGPLGELVARAILGDLYKFIVPAVAGPARLVPLPALATPEISATLSAWPRSADASRRPRQLTAPGAAHASGSRSTPRPATSGNDPTPRRNRPGYKKSPAMRGFSSAPERTRTSTDQLVHKALNPNRPV